MPSSQSYKYLSAGLVLAFISGCGNGSNSGPVGVPSQINDLTQAVQQVVGATDLGDLPDPGFPTRLISKSSRVPGRTGPRHADLSQEWLGRSPTANTTREADALIPDGDFDDGFVRLLQPTIQNVDTRIAFATVPVTVAQGADTSLRYLNVAADFNGSGTFERYSVGQRTQEEWIVVNLLVSTPPGHTELTSSPFVVVDPGALLGQPCTRATLSTQPIDPALFESVGGWDGSGPAEGFLRGETEDHCVQPQRFVWQSRGTGWHPPDQPPELIIRRPPPKQPGKTPPTAQPPFLEPDLRRHKIPPQNPQGSDPRDDQSPRQEGVITQGPSQNHYIPRDQGVDFGHAKQGENECVPTSTANSVRYLLNKRRHDNPSAPALALEDQSAEQLRDYFKQEMGTTAANGTDINPTASTQPGFLAGKAAFSTLYRQQAPSSGGGLETTSIESPSFKNICDCIKAGFDVEILIAAYDPDTGLPDTLGHMVQVVGCNQLPSGELELVLNDPALEDEDSNNGMGTVTVPVSNGAGLQSSDSVNLGGLDITHYPVPLEHPRILRIDHLFCEQLIP